MVTLKQLFHVFGHDPKWHKLAIQSARPMVLVFIRKLGDTDITTLTDFDIELMKAKAEELGIDLKERYDYELRRTDFAPSVDGH